MKLKLNITLDRTVQALVNCGEEGQHLPLNHQQH